MKAKVSALLVFTLWVIAPLFSQESKQKYIQIIDYKYLPIITISNVVDFDSLISNNKIQNIFLYIQDKSSTNTIAIIQVGEVFYSFNLVGYFTIDDYKNGIKQKFMNGQDYYDSKKIGIEDSSIYYYYKRNEFTSLADCIDAFQKGYVFDDYSLPSIILPIEISKEQVASISKYFSLINNQYSTFYKDGKCEDVTKTIISRTIAVSYQPSKIEVKEYQIYYISRIFVSNYNQYLQEYEIGRASCRERV